MHLIENTTSVFHVLLGVLALVTGTIALYSKKGRSNHVRFGNAFVWTMVLSSLIGAAIGLFKISDFFITTLAGILSASLVLSGVLTLKLKKLKPSKSEMYIGIVNGLNFCTILTSGILATQNSDGIFLGFHAEDFFFLSGMSAIALLGDVKYFTSSNIPRTILIARHLWRMCLGLFIAAGSAFTGPGMVVFPNSIQQSGLLSLPELIIIITMIYWLIRARYLKSKLLFS